MRFSFGNRAASGRPAGVVGKVGLSLFLSLFLGMGLLFLGLLGSSLLGTLATYQWKPTPATIVASGVGEREGADSPFFADVTFRYEWGGRGFTSDRFSAAKQTHSSYDHVQASLVGLTPGTATTCFVNPRDPSSAVLRREGWWIGFFLLIPIVFVLVGAGGIYGVWFGKNSKSAQLSPSPGPSSGTRTAKLVGGIFALVGAGLLVFWFLPTLAKSMASARWVETPCTVISSRVKSHSDSDGTTYSVDIYFRYAVAGKEFKSNRYSLFGGSSSGYEGKAEIVARYPAGRQAACFVNPDNPQEVVLKPGVGWAVLFGLIPLAFLGVGLAVLVWGGKSGSPAKALASGFSPPPDGEPLTLKPSASPLLKLAGAVGLALFWNGIVSVFVWQVVGGFSRGRPDWFLVLFLVPFVTIGVGMVGGVVYFFMALWNPRCRLRLNPPVLVPGRPLEVYWELSGSASRLDRLLIYLEGREEATYRRGTSNVTDTEAFLRLPIVETRSPLEMAQGEARCVLPVGVMPTFTASNNKISWSIKVRGDIPRWPDANEAFPVSVVEGGAK